MRIRFQYAVTAELAYLSHLDLMRLLTRALRRAGLPVAFSQGYNPRPRLTLAAPLPVGVTGKQEYGDLYLAERLSLKNFLCLFQEQLPRGLSLKNAVEIPLEASSIAAEIDAALYQAYWMGSEPPPGAGELRSRVSELAAREKILVRRRNKKGFYKEVDIRPYIKRISILDIEEETALELLLQLGSKGGVSPSVVLKEINVSSESVEYLWRMHRAGLYIHKDGELAEPLS